MKTKIKTLSTMTAGYVVLVATKVYAVSNPAQTGANKAKDPSQPSDLLANVKLITNTLLLAIGVISVIMIVIGGIRYATSGGDEKGVKGAKDTILYAVIGLVLSLLAFAIVNFVLEIF